MLPVKRSVWLCVWLRMALAIQIHIRSRRVDASHFREHASCLQPSETPIDSNNYGFALILDFFPSAPSIDRCIAHPGLETECANLEPEPPPDSSTLVTLLVYHDDASLDLGIHKTLQWLHYGD